VGEGHLGDCLPLHTGPQQLPEPAVQLAAVTQTNHTPTGCHA